MSGLLLLCHDWFQILSTNIAETSITINDVVYVLDSGKVKEVMEFSTITIKNSHNGLLVLHLPCNYSMSFEVIDRDSETQSLQVSWQFRETVWTIYDHFF